MTTTVTTQAELDAALASGEERIVIKSVPGVWLTLYHSGSATVRATGSATVRAYDSATVEAYGSATVRATGSATVWATGAVAVQASDSATVRATGSATVRAYDSATVYAYDSATVQASGAVAVHLLNATAKVTGGTVIDATGRHDTAEAWCDYHGVTVTDRTAILYKAVHDNYQTGRGDAWTYTPGSTVVAQDYSTERECGQGLHLCPTPVASARYLPEATRYVACRVSVDEIVPLDDKCKVRAVEVLHEVDLDGEALS